MAARTRKGTSHNGWDKSVRERIQTSMLMNRLKDHVVGKVELSQTQVRAAEILLRKALPDLAAIEHSGDVETSYVVRMPEPVKDMAEWSQRIDGDSADKSTTH